MSGLVVALRIVGDGSDARAEIVSVAGATDRLKGSTDGLTGASGRAAGAARGQAAANAALAQSQRGAAAATGNLAAQFNDIGMMMAAGQNPLQLAIQQGTQITQVLGGAGAGGALALLKQGFLSLMSPLNLITIGTIAGGAALIQWLTGAGEAALTLEDRVEALADQTDLFREAAERASSPLADLRKEFGETALAARAYLQDLAEVERREAERAAADARMAMRSSAVPSTYLRSGEDAELSALFGLKTFSRSDFLEFRQPVLDALTGLEGARGIEEGVSALERLKAAFEAAAMASGDYSAEEDAVLRQINALLVEQSRLRESIREADRAARAEEASALLAERAADRGDSPREVTRRINDREARAEAAELRQVADLNRLIAAYGEESFRVAVARRSAERAVFAELVGQRDVSAAVKTELMAAWDAANGIGQANIASAIAEALGFSSNLQAQLGLAWDHALGVAQANMAGPISAAAGAAQGLAGWLGQAYQNALLVARQQAAASWVEGQQPGGAGRLADQYALYGPGQVANRNATIAARYTGPTVVAGGGAAAEADAVAELIAELEHERDLRGELDPVMQEMARHRAVLAEATAAERAQVEELIRARIEEASRMEALRFVAHETGEALIDALMGGKNAAEQLVQSLARAVLQAALLGTGPLAGVFGGGPGLIGMIFGVKSFDGGGHTGTGARTGGADGKGGFPALLHRDEVVVDLRAPGPALRDLARAAPDLLREASRPFALPDDLPSFDGGGFTGTGARTGGRDRKGGFLAMLHPNELVVDLTRGGGSGGAGPREVHHHHSWAIDARGARGAADIEAAIDSGVEKALRHYTRHVLPEAVQDTLDHPRRRG